MTRPGSAPRAAAHLSLQLLVHSQRRDLEPKLLVEAQRRLVARHDVEAIGLDATRLQLGLKAIHQCLADAAAAGIWQDREVVDVGDALADGEGVRAAGLLVDLADERADHAPVALGDDQQPTRRRERLLVAPAAPAPRDVGAPLGCRSP